MRTDEIVDKRELHGRLRNMGVWKTAGRGTSARDVLWDGQEHNPTHSDKA